MKTKSEIIEILRTPASSTSMNLYETVKYDLVDAEVLSAKIVDKNLYNSYRRITVTKIVVKDALLGCVFFQTSSDKLFDVARGDKISLSLTLTGVGTPTEKYPDPIIFAKANTRKRDSVVVNKPAAEPSAVGDDLPVNV